jgi:arginase family enzyme
MPIPAEPRGNAPFVGIPSSLRSLIATDLDWLDADIAVMGVPTDEGSPFMPGSRFGPRGIADFLPTNVAGTFDTSRDARGAARAGDGARR